MSDRDQKMDAVEAVLRYHINLCGSGRCAWCTKTWPCDAYNMAVIAKESLGAPVEPVPAPTSVIELIRDFIGNIEESERRWNADYIASGVLAICGSAPVPAPRLEWERIENCDRECSQTPHLRGAQFKVHHNGTFVTMTFSGSLDLPTDDAAKSLAEKLNAVLSPPVGPQPKGH